MRILMLHNRYRALGGEERAVGEIAHLLLRRGHEVRVLERSSSEVGRARAAASLLGGGLDPDEVSEAERFIALSQVHGARLQELGVPGERMVTLSNFIAEGRLAESSRADEGRYALVSGRLVEEKGFDTAVRACAAAGVPLMVAGEGPDAGRLRGVAAGHEVTFTGRLDAAALDELRRGAAMVLAPSRCEEACPYSVLDAMADGVPVLASARGGLPELVPERFALDPEDLSAWTEAVRDLWSHIARRRRAGKEMLERARAAHGEDAYHERLLDVYRGAAVSR